MTSMSILDQSPIDINETVNEGIQRTVELAQLADKLKYTRYFVAEHHNIPEVAGTSPEILVTHLLNKTNQIRVGSGGVMLQHYSPFKVIEQFHLISHLAPGRVDLGIGKAPGGFPLATQALQSEFKSSKVTFNDKFQLLNRFNKRSFKEDEPYKQLQTSIRDNEIHTPELFLLGGSDNSAQFAANENVGFVYAFFINSNVDTLRSAVKSYKQQYPEGRFIVAIAAVVTENENDKALVKAGRTNYALHFKDGRKITVNTKEQLEDFINQSTEHFEVEEKQIEVLEGSAAEVKQQLVQLNNEGLIDEFMLHMPVQNHKLRLKTVEQLAPLYTIANQKEGVL
ncbi:MsnO8 family LLM class oxidoreductase [Staphylococcus shinii]|uniref:MsnO8 family LLM class oxidoreductase n=1 Tax=Staphylococcus TaxID=1279 RepID=UPI0008536FFC|nr:MsnO8 family LLM class oxidoreductase [Staphylococcus shinii]MBO3065539.1 MsnO8 family LLM class oxidoreductase [Staphylococcus shinii]MEC5300859.1 MsnO8 family LLM class oxidoreductase [Staphylococcus shinii]OEK89980.1 oxidoreductase [Staphylococcus shinii]PKI10158.1 LLM class flavin-dependent oxidoreductase [Staphylococcus shinii]QRA17254.1 MsnO8 family LLM class oxidoreductase [Staphylococcus shinii]